MGIEKLYLVQLSLSSACHERDPRMRLDVGLLTLLNQRARRLNCELSKSLNLCITVTAFDEDKVHKYICISQFWTNAK